PGARNSHAPARGGLADGRLHSGGAVSSATLPALQSPHNTVTAIEGRHPVLRSRQYSIRAFCTPQQRLPSHKLPDTHPQYIQGRIAHPVTTPSAKADGFVRNACVDNHYVNPNRLSPSPKIS